MEMKKVNLNTSETLSQLKESFNKTIDKKIKKVQLTEKLKEMDGFSFCESKMLFDTLLDKLYENTRGKKLITSYIKLIKENKSINNVYRIMESFGKLNNTNPTLTAYLIGEMCNNINRKELSGGEKKMNTILKEAVKINGMSVEDINNIVNENKKITDNISYFCKNKMKSSNLNESIKIINSISELLNENKVNTLDESNNVDNKTLMRDLNNLMNNDLTLWENKVIKDISMCTMSDGNKEELFETYKNDCISTIDGMLDDSDVDATSRLFSMKQQLSEKKYSEETLTDDLFKLAELKETLKNG